jgi:hypothetical protein
MKLNTLSLAELELLSANFRAIINAGDVLANFGITVQFDLTPGQPVTLKSNLLMPDVDTPPCAALPTPTAPAPWLDLPHPDAEKAQPPAVTNAGGNKPHSEAAEHTGAVTEGTAGVPAPVVPPALAPYEIGDGKLVSGAPLMFAHAKPVDPAPGSVRAMQGSPWTAEEDATAIEVFTQHRLAGHSVKMSRDLTAVALHRPVEGTGWRLRHVLGARVAAILDAAGPTATVDPVPEPVTHPPEMAAPYAPSGGIVRLSGATLRNTHNMMFSCPGVVPPPAPVVPATVPAAPPPSLAQHLRDVPRGLIWTLERDADLLRLSCLGWPLQEIVVEMDLSDRDIKARFEVLLDGKRFKRAEVNIALQAMLAGF